MAIQKIVDYTEVTTTPRHRLGEYSWDKDGRLFQYVQADGDVAQYAYVKISTDGNFEADEANATILPATEPAEVGCAQVAIADNSYGWVFRGHGAHKGKYLASCVHNVVVLSTATDGALDDAGTEEIQGLKILATMAAAASAVDAWACTKMTTKI